MTRSSDGDYNFNSQYFYNCNKETSSMDGNIFRYTFVNHATLKANDGR